MRTLVAWMVVLIALSVVDSDIQEVDIDWTGQGENPGQACNGWCEPPGWTKGQPEIYFPFENSDSLNLTDPDQIVDGLFGKSVKSSRDPPELVDVEDVSSACITRLSTCTEGASITAWIKIYDQKGGAQGIISCQDDIDSGGFYAYCGHNPRGDPVLNSAVFDGKYVYVQDLLPRTDGGEWFHLVFVYYGHEDGQGVAIYNNGTEVARDTNRKSDTNIHPDSSGDLVIGRRYKNRNWIHGGVLMDELTLWNVVLTAQDATDIFTNDVRRMTQNVN